MMVSPVRSSSIVILIALVVLAAPLAVAVETTLWQIDTAEQLDQGELEHVTLSSLGEVKLGRSATKVGLEDVALVWSVLRGPGGAIFLGTGNKGQVLRLRGADVEVVADTKSLVVSSLALGQGGAVYAGTLPGGKIYKIPPAAKKAGEAEVFATLDDADHVWALAYDSKRRVLFAATGPEGVVYSIPASGQAEVYYDADDTHALSLLLLEPGGDLLVGTSPEARLIRVTGPGRGRALYDFDATEVKGIAARGADNFYLAVNKFPEPPSLPKTASTKSKTKSRRARPKPGKGKIFRRLPDGSIEPLLEYDDGHLTGVQALDDGLVYAGTGAKGRVVAVDDDRATHTVADVEERQVLALALDSDAPVFVTGDTGAVYRLGKAAAGLAEYRTAPLDAGFISRWGRIDWRGSGQLVIQTRSGHTEEPDSTWSDWSKAVARPGDLVSSPAGRYLQVRARWSRDPNAVLRGIGVYHLRNNQRALISEVEVDTPFEVVRPVVEAKAHAATRPKRSKSKRSSKARSSRLKISWDVENPDNDRLRYRLWFRAESDTTWIPILASDRVLSKTSYLWDTDAVPAGTYLVKVEATDELSNPPGRTTRAAKISPPIVVDNQPPRVLAIKARARKVTGRVVDEVSPIARIEYSLDGRLWRPVGPTDEVFDELDEAFELDLPADLPAGRHTVVVRGEDRAQNSASGRVVVTIR